MNIVEAFETGKEIRRFSMAGGGTGLGQGSNSTPAARRSEMVQQGRDDDRRALDRMVAR